jgi:hypothetical protein
LKPTVHRHGTSTTRPALFDTQKSRQCLHLFGTAAAALGSARRWVRTVTYCSRICARTDWARRSGCAHRVLSLRDPTGHRSHTISTRGGVWATWARLASSRFGALARCSLREAHRASGAKVEPKHSSITATACAARALFRTAHAPENGYRLLLRRTAGHRHCMRSTPRAQYSTRRRTPHRTPCSSVC